jgi:DNA-binding XRE family transcriptional regulator
MDFMMIERKQRQIVRVNGRQFVMVPVREYRRLEQLAERGRHSESDLPPVPEPDAHGNYPAADYISASIARDIVLERRALGLTQEALARLAGVRQETLSRLESGKHSPTVRTVEKIDRALKKAARRPRK